MQSPRVVGLLADAMKARQDSCKSCDQLLVSASRCLDGPDNRPNQSEVLSGRNGCLRCLGRYPLVAVVVYLSLLVTGYPGLIEALAGTESKQRANMVNVAMKDR